MKRVAEVMHIVPNDREDFLNGALHPDEETKEVLWTCGVRKQQYFGFGDLILMTFEYRGEHFKEDMDRMAAYLGSRGHLVRKRRKDVPPELRNSSNWWAPVKRLGEILTEKPGGLRKHDAVDFFCYDGDMETGSVHNDIAYDEDDWTESIHF